MPRIAMISEHASPLADQGSADSGGQNVYVAQLTQRLASCGYEVDVYTRRDDPELPEVVEWGHRARVIHVPAGPPEYVPKEHLLPYMAKFRSYVERRCKQHDYDLIHAHFWMSGLVGAQIKGSLGLPLVVTFHALGRVRRVHQGANDRFPDSRFEIEDRIVATADRIIAECPQDRIDLIHYYAADPYRIAVVPCGFNPREMAPVPRALARARLGLAQHEFIALQLGRLVPRKGIATAVEGYARFSREAHASRLMIVGGDSYTPDPVLTPEIARLQSIARSAGVAHKVAFTGRRDRAVLRYYYSAADVFVTLPWYEPFGITPLEAMSCGLPVIGSRVGGIKYTVQDGVTGCLIPAADPEALARCLAHLQRHRATARELGKRGRLRALQRFTWDKVVRQVESVYCDAMASTRRDVSAAVDLADHPKRRRGRARAAAAYASPTRH